VDGRSSADGRNFADGRDSADGSDFGVHNLPFGVFSTVDSGPRVGVALGDGILDLARLDVPYRDDFARPSLNAFLARGRPAWAEVRAALTELALGEGTPTVPRTGATMHLPFEVADYVDFYSSEHHATNGGRILRPDGEPLSANWKHLPVGYHGRAGTVVVSGTPVVRPGGQTRTRGGPPAYGPSQRLDVEAEVGFVVGVPSRLGEPVPIDDFAEHVFGVVLVNDWSARDIQAWESQPLGPFLAKSFATSVSPWVVPLAALEHARVDPPAQDPTPLPYLRTDRTWGLAIDLEIEWNGTVVSRPPYAQMYWTAAQQLAHLTVNGASLRTGDLYASGTVSGPGRDQVGSLLELTWNGREPVTLADGRTRGYLEDGDTITIRGTAPGPDGTRIGFGEVSGQIRPAVVTD
jgi:fumarylacetoacetase